jgi:hypothetical protein
MPGRAIAADLAVIESTWRASKSRMMPLYGKALVLRQDLIAEPGRSLGAAQARGRVSRDQMRMQDRLVEVLQSRTLAHDLISAGDLPAEGLRRFIRDPNFWKEAAAPARRPLETPPD